MKLAIVQQHATRDKAGNIERGVRAFERAASQGAELVAFAELAFDYFLPQHPAGGDVRGLAEPIPGPTTDTFSKLAKKLGVAVVLNLFERDGDDTFDSSPVIDTDGTILGITRMIHIIEAPCFHEKGYYTPGNNGAPVFETKAGKIGVAICYDRHFPEYMRSLALKGADLVVVPQAGAVDEWPADVFEAELQIASFHNGYFAALANRVGTEDCLTFAGESFMTAPDGRVVARAPRGEDHILIHDLDFGEIAASSARMHFLKDRRPDIYHAL
jgi:N-carbamoylputrescine amidase